jgi:non-specific serine/threonine protein kinase/serine/threonine-protein kinase
MMANERWLRTKQLFSASIDLTRHDRDAFLAHACLDDTALRQDVESLLESYLRSGTFLEEPAGIDDRLLRGNLEGTRIGPYEIGPRIGAGGMGDVYRARDTRLNRTVAIKVRADRLTDRPDLREQFAREAKAISALNHPRICLLHDVGHHGSIDFLVMEHVEGEAIDLYCERRGLSTRQRLSMFRTVCEAVHYAHQNLVVHRDLKPANILVSADGQPKLLDFGIAKLLDAATQADDSVATLSPVLTPDYASPEQVRGQAVTTATDVYSLGIVLYELLVGCRPFTVRTASLEDIVRSVCEGEPTPPSARLRDLNAGSEAAVRSPKELRGDLDTIVLKALRKEPERRYLSAQALSDDIKRYLDGQPVGARGDAVAYRLAKFIARHRAGVLVAALFLVCLVAAMTLIVRQSQIAEIQRQRAERRFNDVRRLAGSFLFEFHDAIKFLPGSTRARELVTKRALEYLDSLAGESADDPALGAELARAYVKVADVLGDAREANLGNVAGALASYRKALALQEPLVAARPLDRSLQTDLARTLRGLGDAHVTMRELPAAIDNYRRALSIGDTLTDAVPGDRDARRDLALIHHRLAAAFRQLNDREGANDSLQRAIAILEVLAADVADVDSRHALVRSRKALALLRADQGDHRQSLALLQEALRLNEALALADPVNMTFRNEVAMSHFEVGRAQERLGNHEEALASSRRAETITASMAAADPSNAQARWLQGLELNFAGHVLRNMHRQAEAVDCHLKALALLEGVARADPTNESYRYAVANTFQLLGDAYVAMARDRTLATAKTRAWSDARTWYRRSAATFDAMRRRGTLTGAVVRDADHVAAELAQCERALNDLEVATRSGGQ